MNLTLSRDEARLLKEELIKRVEHIDRELVRTDDHALQHSIARDQERLRSIAEKIERLLAAPETDARV